MDVSNLIDESNTEDDGETSSLDVLFATSELAPFAKTGGLADVAASLPKALQDLGHEVSILLPLYRHIDPDDLHLARRLTQLEVPRRSKQRQKVEATVWEGRHDRHTRIFFIEQDDYFGHEGVYGYDEALKSEDAAARYSFFSRAIVEFARQFPNDFDVLHCNDWHTALAPVYRSHYFEDELGDCAVVTTIHNLAYQGTFPEETFEQTGLPKTYNSSNELKHGETINFLKGAIRYSDALTTVSPTYAEEIQTEEGGHGLEGPLAERSDDLHGILNGVDYSVWSPDVDPHIPVQYDLDRLNGKRQNKAELQHHFDLDIRPSTPLLGFIGRLTDQKGLDLLVPTLRTMLDQIDDPREGFQVVLLGEGDDEYEARIRELADEYDRWVGIHVGYDETLAHQFQAGCDMLMLPSRYEPCGLTQMYAMKYGTLPIAHATGGLVDTITDVDDDSTAGPGTGFLFEDHTEDAFRTTINRALEYFDNYRRWRPIMERAMEQNFSWARSATRYAELYKTTLDDLEFERAAE
jgi:starch synthase